MDTRRLFTRTSITTLGAALLLQVAPASAQFNISGTQRAEDGTVYEVVSVPTGSLQGGPDKVRVTTIAGSQIGLQASPGIGNMSGDPVCALTGGDQSLIPPQVLHPFGDTLRSHLFLPSSLMPTFVPNGSGRVIFGDMEVCRNAANCSGGVADVPVVSLDSSAGNVPAACVANGVTAPCASGSRSTIAFGLPATNNVCDASPTTGSTICAPEPADGFDVGQGQVVVFIYDSGLGGVGFTIGAGGFGIDTNDANDPGCDPGEIVTSAALAQAAPAQPFTPTPTPTNTFTNTPTPTDTFTPTQTPTETNTRTPTNTFTPTPTDTPTRPPVPLISSPTSPAGAALILALGIGLLWALRRFSGASN